MMTKYKILRTGTGVWQEFGLMLLFGTIFISIMMFFLLNNFDLIMSLIIFYIIRLVFYSLIDFVFVKTIFDNGIQVFIAVFFMKIKIDKKRAFTSILRSPSPSRYAKHYCLVLVRNDEKWLNRLFKNKIILYAEDSNLDLEGIANKISDMFGINSQFCNLG